MKKLKVEVRRTDEFEIEIDETIWDAQALKGWSSVFWKVESTEDLAESIAEAITRNGSEKNFIEGFGNIKTLYRDGSEKTKYKKVDGDWKKDDDYAKGIVVRVICEDDDYETEILD